MEYKKLCITSFITAALLFNTSVIQTGRKPEVTSEILYLPAELLCKIFSYVDKKTLYNALYANKSFHAIAALYLPECLWQEEGLPAFSVLRDNLSSLINHPEDIQKAIFRNRLFWDLATEKEIDPQQLTLKAPFFRALFSSRLPDNVFDELCASNVQIGHNNSSENSNGKKIELKYAELLKKFGYKVQYHDTNRHSIDNILECSPMHITSIISEKDQTEIYSLVDFDCNKIQPRAGALVTGFNAVAPDSFMKWFTAEIISKKLWYIRVKNHSVNRLTGNQLSPRDVQVALFEKFFRKCYLPNGLCLVIDAVQAPNSSIINLVNYKKLVSDTVAQWIMVPRMIQIACVQKIVSPKKITPIIWKNKLDLRTQFYESFEGYNSDDDAYYTYQTCSSGLPRNISCKKIVATIFQWHPDLQKIKQIFCTEPFVRCKQEETKQLLRSFIDDIGIKKAETFSKIVSFLESYPDVDEHTIEDGLKRYSKIIFDDEIDKPFWRGCESHKTSYVNLFKNVRQE